MKTLLELLEGYRPSKDIDYPDKSKLDVYSRMTMGQFVSYVKNVMKSNSEGVFFREMATATQVKKGVQVVVSKEVSDELEGAQLEDISYESILWPAESVEIFFEDPRIPTVLLQTLTAWRDLSIFKGPPISVPPGIQDGVRLYFAYYHPQAQPSDPPLDSMISLGAPLFQAWMKGELEKRGENWASQGVVGEQRALDVKARMFQMCVKVLLYIAIPRYKAVSISPHTLHHGGRPGGRHNRPYRPITRTVYVPLEHDIALEAGGEDERKASGNKTGRSPRSHARRHCFRTLKSERFTNKRWQTIYIRPAWVHGSSGADGVPVKTVYVARPTTASAALPDTATPEAIKVATANGRPVFSFQELEALGKLSGKAKKDYIKTLMTKYGGRP